ncbi:hypothetical protein [Aquimarina algiphila]|uniref:hypothetical protein n=1 Tax=Aquimarina algiphila TaxID=2047982 RepID=UPI00232C618C|nr:hypothetical protein [Aquimarina algiphila]
MNVEYDIVLTWGGLILVLEFVVVLYFNKHKIQYWSLLQNKKRIEAANCIVERDHIYFPKGYYFKFGYLKNKDKLPFSVINEIRTNTFPITARINTNEIVFLLGLDEEKCIQLKDQANIILTNPMDNWSLICEEFLDTECSVELKERILQRLEKNGIHPNEVAQIKKHIASRMLFRTFISWEWQYYGQFDVLKALWFLNSKKYWWTMDIALRTHKKQ